MRIDQEKIFCRTACPNETTALNLMSRAQSLMKVNGVNTRPRCCSAELWERGFAAENETVLIESTLKEAGGSFLVNYSKIILMTY